MSKHCQCEACAETPAPTYTRAFAQRCEARFVLSLPLERRNQYYDKVARLRGDQGLERLRRLMRRELEGKLYQGAG